MVNGRKRRGMKLVVRARPEVKPLLLKLGVAAFALSLAGFFVSHLRSRSRPSARSPCPSAAGAMAKAGRKPTGGFKEELRVLKNEEALAKIINGTSTTTTTTTTTTATTTTTTFVGLSPTRRSSGEEEGSLLREFNDLVSKEFGRDVETTRATSSAPKLESKEETAMEQEVAHLRKLVWSLRERERSLELQLLEYYGMKEQEAAMRELESQLKLNSMETKLYSLKVNSLQAENQRLQSKLSDYSRAIDELNVARAKIKHLKKKLRSETLQAKERIASLHQRIVLQCREQKDGRNNADVERKLKRLEELENEVTELRMENSKLGRENSDLARRLEATQILASSVLESPEPEASEKVNQLRQANDQLTKDLEQLRTDRCADVEELVYLRWVNACLRYELRNYQCPPGKTVARDLSKTLNPQSEEKAKKLILEYASSGANEKTSGLTDFDSEYSSSSQASNGEPDDSCVDVSSKTKHNSSINSKFFSKLRKLVLGKGTHRNKILSADRSAAIHANFERRASFSSCSNDDTTGRDSCNSFSSCVTDEAGHTSQLAGMEAHPDEQHQSKNAQFQASLDTQRLRKLNLEEVYGDDDERPCKYNKDIDFGEERSLANNNLFDPKNTDTPEKVELIKYADALKSTRGAESSVGDHQPLVIDANFCR